MIGWILVIGRQEEGSVSDYQDSTCMCCIHVQVTDVMGTFDNQQPAALSLIL